VYLEVSIVLAAKHQQNIPQPSALVVSSSCEVPTVKPRLLPLFDVFFNDVAIVAHKLDMRLDLNLDAKLVPKLVQRLGVKLDMKLDLKLVEKLDEKLVPELDEKLVLKLVLK